MAKKQAKKATKNGDKGPIITTSIQTVARLEFLKLPLRDFNDGQGAGGAVNHLQLWPRERLVATASCGDTAMVCSDKETRMALAEWLASTLGCKLVPIEAT